MSEEASYGGDYEEWGIGCPDGEVWPDTADTQTNARLMLLDADKDCGCESSPHVIVRRDVPEWEKA